MTGSATKSAEANLLYVYLEKSDGKAWSCCSGGNNAMHCMVNETPIVLSGAGAAR